MIKRKECEENLKKKRLVRRGVVKAINNEGWLKLLKI